MEKNELLDRLHAGTMTRREFKKALAAVGLGLFAIPFISRRGKAAADDNRSSSPGKATRYPRSTRPT